MTINDGQVLAPPSRRRWGGRSRWVLVISGVLVMSGLAATGFAVAKTTTKPSYRDARLSVSARVSDLLGRMSLADKVGQMTQVERYVVTADDITTYRIGSVLSGGGSGPTTNTPSGWADMIDDFQQGALDTPWAYP